MIRIRTNANEVSAKLSSFKSLDLTDLTRTIAGDLADITESAFEKERDPVTGSAWKRLSKTRIRQRRKMGKWPGKKLQVTGRLAASITTKHTRTKARIGTNVNYALPNQDMRRFIGISARNKAAIGRKAALFVKKRFNLA